MPRVAIIQGHPDNAGNRFCHALADAYAGGASLAGHQVWQVGVAGIEFPLLRTQEEFRAEYAIVVAGREALRQMRDFP